MAKQHSHDVAVYAVKFTLEEATKAQRGSWGIALLFLNLGARWGGWSTPRPGRSNPGKEPVHILQEAGGPQSRSEQVRKISPPPGFDPRTVQPVASRYTDWAITAAAGYAEITNDRHTYQSWKTDFTLDILSSSVKKRCRWSQRQTAEGRMLDHYRSVQLRWPPQCTISKQKNIQCIFFYRVFFSVT